MRLHPALAAAILAGIFSTGMAVMAHPANDNAAKPAPFDHKSLGKDVKDCAKCHNPPAPAK